jgi:integrase
MKLWLDTIASRKVRPSTLAGYRTCVNRITRHLGHHRLDRLQPEHLEAFYTRLEADGLSPTTALLHHQVTSRALKVAMQRGRVTRNVATLVDAPTARRDEVQPLTAAEARRILDVAGELPNGTRWSVALALGLRQGEALGQTEQRLAAGTLWEDRDFVFCQKTGRPIDARRDWLDWKALLKAAGIRDARLHDARHTAATLLLQQGVPARVVMKSSGTRRSA